jgi:L-asparaginase II
VLVAGTRRDPTALMTALPGVVVKDGAEGVGVAVLPNGTAIAVKVADGAERARQVALARLLALAGLAVPERFGCLAVDGGGRPVGAVSSPLS